MAKISNIIYPSGHTAPIPVKVDIFPAKMRAIICYIINTITTTTTTKHQNLCKKFSLATSFESVYSVTCTYVSTYLGTILLFDVWSIPIDTNLLKVSKLIPRLSYIIWSTLIMPHGVTTRRLGFESGHQQFFINKNY